MKIVDLLYELQDILNKNGNLDIVQRYTNSEGTFQIESDLFLSIKEIDGNKVVILDGVVDKSKRENEE